MNCMCIYNTIEIAYARLAIKLKKIIYLKNIKDCSLCIAFKFMYICSYGKFMKPLYIMP